MYICMYMVGLGRYIGQGVTGGRVKGLNNIIVIGDERAPRKGANKLGWFMGTWCRVTDTKNGT